MSEYLEIYEGGDRFGTISESGEVRILEVSTSGVPELSHGQALPIPEHMINDIERRIEVAKINHQRDLKHNEHLMTQAAISFEQAKEEKDLKILNLTAALADALQGVPITTISEGELKELRRPPAVTERDIQRWFFDKCITIEQDTDSVRDAWFEGSCICDGFHTTGNESVVEEAAYAHVDRHMEINMLAEREVFQVLDLGSYREDENFDEIPLDPPLLESQETSSLQQANVAAQSRANTTRRPQLVQRKWYTRWENLNKAEPNEAPPLDPEVHKS